MANSLGDFSGDIMTRRVIGGIKKRFPALGNVSTDFSDETAKLNQTITTRVVTNPTVADYSTTTNGKGYLANAGNAATTDVDLTMTAFKHVTLRFYPDEITKTNRDLVGEQIERAAYSMGRGLLDAIWGLATPANFPAATNETIETAANCDHETLAGLRSTLRARGVAGDLFSVFGSTAFGNIGKDARFSSRDFTQAFPDYDGGVIENAYGFRMIMEDAGFATANNLVGFAGAKDALLVATRVPDDAQVLARRAGLSIPEVAMAEVVTDADTGMSMLYRLRDNDGELVLTLAWIYGVARGVANSGQLIVSTTNVST